jgi:hypothetical protein
MFRDDRVAGSWADLVIRLNAGSALTRWSEQEPALAGLTCAEDIVAATAAGTAPERSDEVLAALVRMAATDGGGEPDAVLLVLHLLSPGVKAMAARYAGLSPDLMAAIVSELAARIAAFPWRRRHRAVAANLLLDTRAAILRELRPRQSRGFSGGEELPLDPAEIYAHLEDRVIRGDVDDVRDPAQSDDGPDLRELLSWALRGGVARHEDLRLLLELETAREHVRAPRLVVAAAHGISEKTVRRRRDRALNALRQARSQYLAAVA